MNYAEARKGLLYEYAVEHGVQEEDCRVVIAPDEGYLAHTVNAFKRGLPIFLPGSPLWVEWVAVRSEQEEAAIKDAYPVAVLEQPLLARKIAVAVESVRQSDGDIWVAFILVNDLSVGCSNVDAVMHSVIIRDGVIKYVDRPQIRVEGRWHDIPDKGNPHFAHRTWLAMWALTLAARPSGVKGQVRQRKKHQQQVAFLGPAVRYSEIQVPHYQYSGNAPRYNGERVERALHIVGEYWRTRCERLEHVCEHLRGNRERGVVISHYKVKP